MRHYEIMLLIHPDRGDQVSSMVKRYTQLIESANGVVHRLEDWKRRLLAYPINKLNKAYYILLNIECLPKTQQELKDSMAFNDSILRCLSIRRTKALTEPSVLNSDRSAIPTKETETTAGSEKPKNDESSKDGVKTDIILERTNGHYPKKAKYRTVMAVKDTDIDYKNVEFLVNYLTDTKKMARRRVTGANAKQQHRLSEAIKRARLVGLLPHCDKYEQPEIN
jgi:small subunit ribosomal protein S6